MIRRLPAALAGLLTLATGLIGLPAFLIGAASQFAGLLPAAGDLPAALLAPGDGGLFLATLLGIGWLCWLVFVIAFLVEIVARIRGVRAPHLGRFIPQHTTGWAITAVVALLASLTPAPAGIQSAGGHSVAVATATAVPATEGVSRPAHNEATAPRRTTADGRDTAAEQDYRVRRGDTLWGIAEDKLDDATKWPRIAQASRSIDQPDGRHLTDPDLILPGWTLHIPKPVNAAAKAAAQEPAARPSPSVEDPAQEAPLDSLGLPGTPLRPSTKGDTAQGPDASTNPTRAGELPTSLLRPSAAAHRASGLVASAGTTEPAATLPGTALHQTAQPLSEPNALVAPVPGLPRWVRHPLTPTPLEQAPQATRSQILVALANERGLYEAGP